MSGKALAIDYGASGGRAVLASHRDGSMQTREIRRFDNHVAEVRGCLYWNVLSQFGEILESLRQAGTFDSVGIDTWGTDFGFLDHQGRLLRNPVHYRDVRHAGGQDKIEAVAGRSALYRASGIQRMDVNTASQLYCQMEGLSFDPIGKLLMLPDLFAYFLTGDMRAEYTIASTTQLVNAHTKTWDAGLLDALSFPARIFCDILPTGETHGLLSPDICEQTGCRAVPLVATASHDTASAVAAVPEPEKPFVFISSGTWSLIGAEVGVPVINELTERESLTNEGGYGNTIRLLKNITGLWLIQETRRCFRERGEPALSYAQLEQEALGTEPFAYWINPNDPVFTARGDMPARIRAYCERTGQGVPPTRGALVRCIYDSLALQYRRQFRLLGRVTGRAYDRIHIVGGGAKDSFLCQLTADACQAEVFAGPIEATAIGNSAVQLISLGEYPSLAEARAVIARSFPIQRYTPQNPAAWDRLAAAGLPV